MTDTVKLREEIENRGLKLTFVAEKLGLTYPGFLKKLNNETEFKASEISKLYKLLNLTEEERNSIFFAKDVDETATF